MADIYGLDDLREWLKSNSFRISRDSSRNESGVNWYAYRPTRWPGRECECNEGKACQLVVWPHDMRFGGHRISGVELEVSGEALGIWWKFRGYSISVEDLPQKIDTVEHGLVAAWNAIAAPPEAVQGGANG